MDNAGLLVVAMAEQCRALIQKSTAADSDLPRALRRHHLLWMCDRIEKQAEEWPVTKLHRWIGFIQAGMLANRMLDFAGAKAMFDEARDAYGINGPDENLLDHLDPASSFELDIGGEG
jgi:hypothetical protein